MRVVGGRRASCDVLRTSACARDPILATPSPSPSPYSPYMAAKAMESAGQLCAQQLKRLEEGARYYARAAELFQLNNNLDRAVEQLEKAGK